MIGSPAVGTDGTFVYSAGGYHNFPTTVTNGFYRYDPVANVWMTLGHLPTGLALARGVYAANTNTFYVFGGTSTFGNNVLDTVYRYNLGTNTWTTGAHMPEARYRPNVAYYAATGKIYVIGGFDIGLQEQKQTWEYDPIANTWNITRANIPVTMGGSVTSISGPFIYLVGSLFNGPLHYRYNITNNTWTLMAPAPDAVEAGSATGAAIDGQTYVFGGDASTSTYVYDIASNSWTSGPNTNVPHRDAGGVAIGHRLLVVAGFTGATAIDTVEIATAIVDAAAGSTLVNESCPPANGVVDPGETVTMNLNIINNGSAATNNLVATLQPSANVLAPSRPASYGAIAPGNTVGRDFSFTASGNCGDGISLTLQLQDGVNDLGNITYSVTLGNITATVLSENFDDVTAPELPAGWTSTASGVEVPWVTSTTAPFSAPNEAFAPDPDNVGETALFTPVIAVPAAGAQLTFKNNYNTERLFDGMVLEISINGGPFNDIIDAGGSFMTGGYNETIISGSGSPISGRMAWTGSSGGYINSTVNLPAAANGQIVQLKWRMATDFSNSMPGVRIDDVVISSTTVVCNTACAGAPRISTAFSLSCSGANKVANITISNSGTADASDVTLTVAKLGGVSGTPLPQTIGTLTPGQSVTRSVSFTGAPSGSTTLQAGGTHAAGTFNSSRKVTAPACP